jgi:alpha-1,2-mannosyltransferase
VTGRSERRWLAAGAVVLIVAGIAAAVWMLHPYGRKFDLIDLAVYRAAGKAVLHGRSVFGPYVAHQLRVPLPFIYPPVAAVFAIPFTLMPVGFANVVWTLITLALLFGVVKLCFAPSTDGSLVALMLAFGVALALSPVQENLRFGQLGIALMACCVFDCMVPRTRWPRGVLVGIAAAVKLVPAIFVPYLWLTGRRRAAYVAIATFVGCTVVGWVADASDSWEFFRHRMFEPTSPKYFSNQSLEGMLQRFIGPWRLIWLPAVAVIIVFGLWQAARASRAGDELRGVAITGLVGVIVSPISWVHHIVWIVPAIAAILATGTDKGRRVLAFVVAALFVARLPYVGNDELHGTGFVAAVLEDGYGIISIVLFAYLTDAVGVSRRAIDSRRAARSRATTSASRR